MIKLPNFNKMTQEQAEAMRANDLFGNLYSRAQADMLAIDMDIVGDPTYIQEEEFTLNPDRKSDFLDKSDLRLTNNQSFMLYVLIIISVALLNYATTKIIYDSGRSYDVVTNPTNQ